MTRKEFISQVGVGAATLFIPACLSGLAACQKSSNSAQGPTVDFNVSIASGPLASNGGYIVQNGVIVARTNSGAFIAVAAACTHQGSTVAYYSSSNNFICPSHGAQFDTSGNVTAGPAQTALKKYNTSLSGTSLRVYS
jgi:cytochrome b6-f complex iron-sulfur subunit